MCLVLPHFPIYQKRFNPLTPGAFCQKCVLWTFWWFSGWISAKLALIWSKRHLQHDSLPFLPLTFLQHFDSGMCRNQNFEKFCSEFSLNFLSIFVYISGSNGPITLIWASLKISFPPSEDG